MNFSAEEWGVGGMGEHLLEVPSIVVPSGVDTMFHSSSYRARNRSGICRVEAEKGTNVRIRVNGSEQLHTGSAPGEGRLEEEEEERDGGMWQRSPLYRYTPCEARQSPCE